MFDVGSRPLHSSALVSWYPPPVGAAVALECSMLPGALSPPSGGAIICGCGCQECPVGTVPAICQVAVPAGDRRSACGCCSTWREKQGFFLHSHYLLPQSWVSSVTPIGTGCACGPPMS